jgi:beta-glucanase (GH16 family)
LGGYNGPSETITSPSAIAPGESRELTIPYASVAGGIGWHSVSKYDGLLSAGGQITSNAISYIAISVTEADSDQTLVLESIVADVPPSPTLPDWLGQRPPVQGNWIQTINDNFDGSSVDLVHWSITGPNYWDQISHWSPSNVSVSDGFLTIRYEKKTGSHNDDPNGKVTDYAGGFLYTYGKWVQRYGYFEARMKLPTAPGLWPAFWLMPDRGIEAGGQPERQDTANGGMEFDIFEQLTGWGPYRTNVALHWDGYKQDHKMVSSSCIYFQPDEEGFVTTGLLWLPELAAFYINGKEVFRYESPRIGSIPSDIMFTIPSGGWDNTPLDDALLPDNWVLDYVRVWQRCDLASPMDGLQPYSGTE